MKVALIGGAIAIASLSSAYVVPNGFETSPANLTFSLTSTTAGGRTYQFQLHESQLAGLVGMNLDGLQFRLNETVASDWPTIAASFTQWDIFIGQGVDPATRTSTFATNFVGSPTQVRSGPLTFSVASFSSVGTPVKPFGPVITFNNSYLYTGGHLTIEMRFSQMTGSTTQPSLDAAGTGTTGFGTTFGAMWAGSSTATTATGSPTANVLVTNILASPVPEPATMAILGLGALALVRRRRKV